MGGRLTLLRFLHQFDDARQGCVVGCACRADVKDAMLVQRAGEDAIASCFVDRYRLAGNGAFIDSGITRQDVAINRNALAGLDENSVSAADIADFDLPDTVAAPDFGNFRIMREEPADRAAAATNGVVLQRIAEREQE